MTLKRRDFVTGRRINDIKMQRFYYGKPHESH